MANLVPLGWKELEALGLKRWWNPGPKVTEGSLEQSSLLGTRHPFDLLTCKVSEENTDSDSFRKLTPVPPNPVSPDTHSRAS